MTTEIAFELKEDESLIEMVSLGDHIVAASTKRVYMLEYRGDRAVMSPVPFLYEDDV